MGKSERETKRDRERARERESGCWVDNLGLRQFNHSLAKSTVDRLASQPHQSAQSPPPTIVLWQDSLRQICCGSLLLWFCIDLELKATEWRVGAAVAIPCRNISKGINEQKEFWSSTTISDTALTLDIFTKYLRFIEYLLRASSFLFCKWLRFRACKWLLLKSADKAEKLTVNDTRQTSAAARNAIVAAAAAPATTIKSSAISTQIF